jgi:hypothetical protein
MKRSFRCWFPLAVVNGSAPLTAQQVTKLFAGRYYANVHTAANPNGEIRGNLTMVSEPGVVLSSRSSPWAVPG